MPTDYILFIHGVNTRERATNPTYADRLFGLIKSQTAKLAPGLQLQKVALYWGDVARDSEEYLNKTYEQSPTWPQFWFRSARENLLLRFIGDTVVYISRYVGARIVETLKDQIVQALAGYRPEERLHVVAHSLGAVILFDILFSSRWLLPDAPGRESVMQIRNIFFGIEPSPFKGISISSIHTLGAPIGLFSLMDADSGMQNLPGATHDITPKLRQLLQNLSQVRQGSPLPWHNFAHPGDALAYPLNPLLYNMVESEKGLLNVQDIIIVPVGLTDRISSLFRQWIIALIDFRIAHISYFQSQKVATVISQAIANSAHVSLAINGPTHETPE